RRPRSVCGSSASSRSPSDLQPFMAHEFRFAGLARGVFHVITLRNQGAARGSDRPTSPDPWLIPPDVMTYRRAFDATRKHIIKRVRIALPGFKAEIDRFLDQIVQRRI